MPNDSTNMHTSKACDDESVITNDIQTRADVVNQTSTANPVLSKTGVRCLIENVGMSNSVEDVHCLPKFSTSNVLDQLEFSWNMPRYSLNVNTPSNIIQLSPTLRHLFKSSAWVLLPEKHIIDQYWSASNDRMIGKGSNFPIIEGTVFRYKLIASPQHMSSFAIHRRKSEKASVSSVAPTADDFTHHLFPYHDFPVITSHIHPRFAICHGGPILQGYAYIWSLGNQKLESSLKKVTQLWRDWALLATHLDGWEEFISAAPQTSDSAHNRRAYFLGKKPKKVSRRSRMMKYMVDDEEQEEEEEAVEEDEEEECDPNSFYIGGRPPSDFSTCSDFSF